MTDRQLDEPPAAPARDSDLWLRRAWFGVALVPLFFFIAFAVGEGIYALMDYKPDNAEAPVWVEVVAAALVVLVILVPCVAAVHFGRRAIAEGEHKGVYPAVIGAVAAVGWITLTVVSTVGNIVRG